MLLESEIFVKVKDVLPKTRYLQAYVKYLKIRKLAKEYKNQLSASGRIRDLIKDCLNDMEMAIETKYGKAFKTRWIVIPPKSPCYSCQHGNKKFWRKSRFLRRRKNETSKCWEPWMRELANIRNYAIHKKTNFLLVRGGDDDGSCYLIAMRPNGEEVKTNEQVLPYLEKTLEKIKAKLEITEI